MEDSCHANSVEHLSTLRHLSVVMQLRTLIVLALALAWLPLTRASELHSVSAPALLCCSSHQEDAPMAHAEPEETHRHFCYLEESPVHLMERRSQGHPPRVSQNVSTEISGRPSLGPTPPIDVTVLTSPPPEISASWVFTHREARPARAPSLGA